LPDIVYNRLVGFLLSTLESDLGLSTHRRFVMLFPF
jgi:hypothetical protein